MANGVGAFTNPYAGISAWGGGDPVQDIFDDAYTPSGYGVLPRPSEQLARYYGTRDWAEGQNTAAQLRARMSQFDPLYGGYQAMGYGQGYESFGDWVNFQMNSANVDPITLQSLAERSRTIAGYADVGATGDIPGAAIPYYGDQGAQNQQRLAQTLGLAGMKGGAQYNPSVQRSVADSISRMYQAYLGTDAAGTVGPTGFLKYYMQQRYPGSMIRTDV